MFFRPRTLDDALAQLATGNAQILAGGTDVFPALVDKPLTRPFLDISGLPELRGISVGERHVRIGACVTWTEIIKADLPHGFDALKAAAREVGSIQIQNRGTVAGNLCNASPAADGIPPLLILDAEVELAGPNGRRRQLPLWQFLAGYRKTARRDDEIVTAIVVPNAMTGARSAFLKLGARRYLVISIVMVAAALRRDDDGLVGAARIAVGSCSAVAQRLPALEAALVGQRATGIGALVADSHLTPLTPIDDVRATAAYRSDAARTLIARALEACVEDA